MADAYWRYADGRTQAPMRAAPVPMKRPRPDYPDAVGGHEYPGYIPREEERLVPPAIRDTESIGASYDRYLRNGISSFGAGETGRPLPAGLGGHPVDDPRMMVVGGVDGRSAGYGGGRPDTHSVGYAGGRTETHTMGYGGGRADSQSGYGGGRPDILPPDASNTLFVEGLPADCTRREVSHIFRPFVGFREVRLVTKESRNPGGDPLILCFVDFSTPSQAAVALDALQGYKFDEHDRESATLRLQFARFPGPRSAAGSRGRR